MKITTLLVETKKKLDKKQLLNSMSQLIKLSFLRTRMCLIHGSHQVSSHSLLSAGLIMKTLILKHSSLVICLKLVVISSSSGLQEWSWWVYAWLISFHSRLCSYILWLEMKKVRKCLNLRVMSSIPLKWWTAAHYKHYYLNYTSLTYQKVRLKELKLKRKRNSLKVYQNAELML